MKKLLKKKSYYKVQGSDYNDLIEYVEEAAQGLGGTEDVKSEISKAIAQAKKELIDGASAEYDTFKEVADYIEQHKQDVKDINAAIESKADKSEVTNQISNINDNISTVDSNLAQTKTDLQNTKTDLSNTKEDLKLTKITLENDYAKQEGYYSDLIAGTAINLEGKNDVINSSMYRATGGVYDVDSGSVTIESIQGNAVAWNQLCKNGNFVNTDNWYIETQLGDEMSVSGNVATVKLTRDGAGNHSYLKDRTAPLVTGHVYLLSCYVKSEYKVWIDLVFGENPIAKKDVSNTGSYFQKICSIRKATTVGSDKFRIYCTSTDSIEYTTMQVKNVQLFDLTLIYGAGKEPTTYEQFEADYQRWFGKQLEYEEYDEGSIRTVLATGIKTVGFNLYNGVDFTGEGVVWNKKTLLKNDFGYNGAFNIVCDIKSDFKTEGNSYDNSMFIRIDYKDGTTSTHRNTSNNKINITTKSGVYSITGTYSNNVNNSNPFTVTNICISMVWSGKRDGDYEPYWEETQSLPITSLTSGGKVIFPDGLKRAGSVYDEIFVENGVTKAVKRVASVDLGTLSWILSTHDKEKKGVFYTAGVKTLLKLKIAGNVIDILCSKYDNKEGYIGYASIIENPKSITSDINGNIVIWDDSYTDVDSFKQSLQGVLLYYELAEPETYVIDNFSLPLAYKVDDFGTEQVLSPDNGIAPVMVTRYGVNAVDTIRRLPAIVETLTNDKVDKSEYNKLLERVLQLESKLNDLNNE